MFGRNILRAFALLLATALPVVGAAEAQPASAASEPDQLLLYEVQLGGTTLTESLSAYGDAADPLLPLGELSRLLEINLDVQPARGIVTGRLGENQRSITIDLAAGKALLGGQVIALVPPDRKVTPTEIYLRASLVAKLLPLRIAASESEMTLTLTATEKLPIEARRERASRLAGLGAITATPDDVLRVQTPYRWASLPSFDFGVELGADSSLGHAVTRLEARMSGDLARTGFSGWFATDEAGKPASARITATRRSAEGDLPLGATYAAAGDVYAPGLALGPRSQAGAGFVVSSARIEDSSVFQHIDLRGELPLGYDVELYINDVLRSGRQGSATLGRYEFRQVPLTRGRNVVRVVLYGPRGERDEQVRVINVGGGQLAAGQTVIDAGIVVQDRALISLDGSGGLLGNKARDSLRAVLGVTHGVSAGLTVNAGLGIYQDYTGRRHEVLTAGLRTALLGMAVQGDLAHDLKGGNALSLAAAGEFAGINFVGRHSEYSGGFNDETNSAWDLNRPMKRFDELTLDFVLPLPGAGRLPISALASRAQYADGGTTFLARARTTASVASTLIALGTDYRRQTGPGGTSEQLTGNVSAMRFIAYKWQLRATADYSLAPRAKLETFGVTVDRTLGERASFRLGATRSFSSRDTAFEAGITARLPFADATLGGSWSTGQRNWRVGVQFNFGLAFDPVRGGYRVTSPGPANGGSASFLAFQDDNANGRFDSGEKPVAGVALQGAARPMVTDAQGRAFITGLGDGGMANLRADITDADAGFVSAPPQNVVLAPRAGHVATILYPLVPTSEVVFRVNFRQQDGTMTGLSAVMLRLIPETGAPIAGKTEFDGTAVFDGVKPGTYRIALDPEQATRLGMTLAGPGSVRIGSDGRTVQLSGEARFEAKVAK
ncbi:hypothetical protein [Novosphingobium sp.]|uniref:hypothetical protein n=1 Tax=Novosphingobium sp. TaxID=1874826 RepID=UPI00286D9EBA|nr:hypothetical protein [Novosphingobium sp.]